MNIYLTLDYELFLGATTGTPQNCLVRPMKEMMDVLEKTDTKLSVLVDGAYLYRMWQLKDSIIGVNGDYLTVIDNIKEMDRRGHSIQYHFHPQWIYSDYEIDQGWKMDFEHYKLSDVPMDVLTTAFKKGVDIIEESIGKKVCAFRAGGYSLCEYSWYGKLFRENGILLDTSVIPGAKVKSRFQRYDYQKSPKKSLYFFKDNVCKEVDGGCDTFIEMPISVSEKMSSLVYLIKKRKLLSQYQPKVVYGDGKGVGTQLTRWQSLLEHLKKFIGTVRMTATIDGFSSLELMKVYESNKRKGADNLVVIGHPKAVTDASLRNLKQFVESMLSAGNEFHTLDEVAKKYKNQEK